MSEPRRSRRRRRGAFALGLGLVAASLTPTWTAAQMEASAGVLVLPEASLGGTQVGPVVSAGVSSGLLGLPLFLEASVGRTDFTSLGQDYHHNHYRISGTLAHPQNRSAPIPGPGGALPMDA